MLLLRLTSFVGYSRLRVWHVCMFNKSINLIMFTNTDAPSRDLRKVIHVYQKMRGKITFFFFFFNLF